MKNQFQLIKRIPAEKRIWFELNFWGKFFLIYYLFWGIQKQRKLLFDNFLFDGKFQLEQRKTLMKLGAHLKKISEHFYKTLYLPSIGYYKIEASFAPNFTLKIDWWQKTQTQLVNFPKSTWKDNFSNKIEVFLCSFSRKPLKTKWKMSEKSFPLLVF